MVKKIKIKELSVNGHETYSVAIQKIPEFMESKLDESHVAYCEPMNKIVENVTDLEYILEKIKEIIIIPKIRGG
ncbi:MAG: hypothetical protein ACFFDN_33145 [Candidatus Hodarchaeota archaeon]